MEGVTPTMYPFGMSCKEFTGANEGVSFSQFYFISTACKSDHFVLSITWAFIIVDLIALVFTLAMFLHTVVGANRITVPGRISLYSSLALASRVVGLLLTLYAVASPIRMFFMTLPLIFTFVSGSVLEFNWLKVMARTDWSRIVGPGVKRDMFKTSMILCCVVFSVVLTGAWAIAPPILRALGYSAHDINISVWVGFVWIALSVWIFLCLTVMSIRKLVGGLSGMVHHAETSGTGEVPDAVLSLLKKIKLGGWMLGAVLVVAGLSMTALVVNVVLQDFDAENTLLWIYFGMVMAEILGNVAFVYMGVRRRAQFISTSTGGSTDIKSKTAPGSKKGTHTGISKNNTELSELATMDDYLTKTKEMQTEWNDMTNNAFASPV